MTPNTTRSRISDRPRRRLARLAAAILIAGGVLALSGCDATTIDVYVETSQTLTGADGATVSQTTYDLDESGNAGQDAPAATIENGEAKITVKGYDVTLPADFDGAPVAEPNQDYTFTDRKSVV